MTTRVVSTPWDRDQLFKLIEGYALPFTVDITKGKRRSVEQNRLQRLWINEVAEQLGDRTAEEIRAECKLTLGVPILRAENEAFCEAYDKHIRPLPYEQKLALMAEPFDFAVTRLMTTDQKTRYLDALHRHYSAQGVILTNPEGVAA